MQDSLNAIKKSENENAYVVFQAYYCQNISTRFERDGRPG